MEQRVQTRVRKDVQVGSEDWNAVLFTGQGIRWMNDRHFGPSIEVSQERAIEELDEIPVEKNTKEDLHCTPAMHTRYRSLLGQKLVAKQDTVPVWLQVFQVLLQKQLFQQLVMSRLLSC